MNALTREDFQKLDHDDPRAGCLEEVVVPQDVIYMEGKGSGRRDEFSDVRGVILGFQVKPSRP